LTHGRPALLTAALAAAAFAANDAAVTFAGRVCESCRSRRVVSLDSPIGRELARDYAHNVGYEQ
jgi:hypothetical protein